MVTAAQLPAARLSPTIQRKRTKATCGRVVDTLTKVVESSDPLRRVDQ